MIGVGDKVSHYLIKKQIGSGGSGVVFLAEDLNNHKLCVVKVIRVGKGVQEQKAIDSEIKVGLVIGKGCLNLVQYNEFVSGEHECYIFMEFCSKGDLSMILADRLAAKKTFTEEEILRFFFDCASGLLTLHTARIVHRDIKTTNIFHTEENIFKIGDYSIAHPADTNTTALMGANAYTPPEVLNGDETVSTALDVYSLGVIVVEMIDMLHPFCTKAGKLEMGRVLAGQPNQARDDLNPAVCAVRDYALTLMALDPNKRPSISSVLTFPLLVGFGIAVRAFRTEPQRERNTQEAIKDCGQTLPFPTVVPFVDALRKKARADRDGEDLLTLLSEKVGILKGRWKDGVGYEWVANDVDKLDGKWVVIDLDGDCLEGDWVQGLPQGRGVRLEKDGNYFERDWGGKIGITMHEDGLRYVGEWKNGYADGEGTLSDAKGTVLFKGQWRYIKNRNIGYQGPLNKEGEPHGKGVEVSLHGTRYEGNYINGKYEGKGTITYPDGRRYVGEWKKGNPDGEGTLRDGKGTILFKGQWRYIKNRNIGYQGPLNKEGEPHGKGVEVGLYGTRYEGNYINGEYEGKGTMIYFKHG